MINRWTKCVSTPGSIRGVAIQATDLVRTMAEVHSLQGIGAQGLGEAVIGALLLGSYCKAGERVNLNIQGSKHYLQALVDAHPDGTVRGYVTERTLTKKEKKAADKFGPWGRGLLSVLRTKGTEGKPPYIGTVPLVTGYLAKDLSFYWMQSEQLPSAVGLAVSLDAAGKVAAAGGFLVQAMPGASDREVRQIEQDIAGMESLASVVTESTEPVQILSLIFQSTAFMLVEDKELKFSCNCSWERVERALVLVGAGELKAMLSEDQHATVRCDFCAKEYKVDAEGLERLILASSGKASD